MRRTAKNTTREEYRRLCPYLIDNTVCGVRERYEKRVPDDDSLCATPFCTHIKDGENFMCGDTNSLDKYCDRMRRYDRIHAKDK